jgi:RHS repeat-associated protein
VTRLLRVTTTGISTEEYGYDAEGRLTSQTLTLASRPAYPLVTNYTYDIFGRATGIQYPAQHGMANTPRKLVQHDYDEASRLKGLKVDGVDYASQLVYNAANQVTSLKVGGAGALQVTESATYDPATGLLVRQQVLRSGATLLDLGYNYLRPGTSSGRTGQLTQLTNHLDGQKNRDYSYDALGRLIRATGGVTNAPLWTQDYGYDRYGNRTGVTAAGTAANGTAIPRDGLAQVSYDSATNRITTANFAYDAAGNLTRALREDGVWQRYQYDAAGRLVKVKDDAGVTLEIHTYGADRRRLITQNGENANGRTYYAWSGNSVLAEYSESDGSPTTPGWTKSFVHLGGRLLATVAAGPAGERVQFHHADRLGTRLVTNATDTTLIEQVTLPYGVALEGESTGSFNPRFTSYQRSDATGLDYAVNRFYGAPGGRFTQVDPLGMGAASRSNPQSLNLYAYVQGDPVNAVDPLGLKMEMIGQTVCVSFTIMTDAGAEAFETCIVINTLVNAISLERVAPPTSPEGDKHDRGVSGRLPRKFYEELAKRQCQNLLRAVNGAQFDAQVADLRSDIREAAFVGGGAAMVAEKLSLTGPVPAATIGIYALSSYAAAEEIVAFGNLPANLRAIDNPVCE